LSPHRAFATVSHISLYLCTLADFYGGPSVTERMKPHNYSITSLNIGLNDPRENALEALINMVKNNAVLRTLVLDLSPHITPRQYRDLASAIRLYNSVLEEVSFSENPLTVKSVEHISRIFTSKEAAISKLTMSNCGLKHLHATALAKHALSARHLRVLDLSGNPLGDKGATALVEMLTGKVFPETTQVQPPLQVLDLSACSFTPVGMAQIMDALSQRASLERVDLSNNDFGPENLPAYAALARWRVSHVRLNSCNIHTKGVNHILRTLADAATPLSQTARYLYLSGNEIADSCVEALCQFLERNTTLEALDLGFNLITDRHAEVLRRACSVVSASTAEKKVSDLTISLVGNKCDPYMLETPGLSRAKSNFLFGVRPNAADPSNHGYTHIAHHSRGHYMARKALDDHYRESLPLSSINNIS
jgi:Ran GTPase-activating protein (RanGAP) involved in mRNA processing and transport